MSFSDSHLKDKTLAQSTPQGEKPKSPFARLKGDALSFCRGSPLLSRKTLGCSPDTIGGRNSCSSDDDSITSCQVKGDSISGTVNNKSEASSTVSAQSQNETFESLSSASSKCSFATASNETPRATPNAVFTTSALPAVPREVTEASQKSTTEGTVSTYSPKKKPVEAPVRSPSSTRKTFSNLSISDVIGQRLKSPRVSRYPRNAILTDLKTTKESIHQSENKGNKTGSELCSVPGGSSDSTGELIKPRVPKDTQSSRRSTRINSEDSIPAVSPKGEATSTIAPHSLSETFPYLSPPSGKCSLATALNETPPRATPTAVCTTNVLPAVPRETEASQNTLEGTVSAYSPKKKPVEAPVRSPASNRKTFSNLSTSDVIGQRLKSPRVSRYPRKAILTDLKTTKESIHQSENKGNKTGSELRSVPGGSSDSTGKLNTTRAPKETQSSCRSAYIETNDSTSAVITEREPTSTNSPRAQSETFPSLSPTPRNCSVATALNGTPRATPNAVFTTNALPAVPREETEASQNALEGNISTYSPENEQVEAPGQSSSGNSKTFSNINNSDVIARRHKSPMPIRKPRNVIPTGVRTTKESTRQADNESTKTSSEVCSVSGVLSDLTTKFIKTFPKQAETSCRSTQPTSVLSSVLTSKLNKPTNKQADHHITQWLCSVDPRPTAVTNTKTVPMKNDDHVPSEPNSTATSHTKMTTGLQQLPTNDTASATKLRHQAESRVTSAPAAGAEPPAAGERNEQTLGEAGGESVENVCKCDTENKPDRKCQYSIVDALFAGPVDSPSPQEFMSCLGLERLSRAEGKTSSSGSDSFASARSAEERPIVDKFLPLSHFSAQGPYRGQRVRKKVSIVKDAVRRGPASTPGEAPAEARETAGEEGEAQQVRSSVSINSTQANARQPLEAKNNTLRFSDASIQKLLQSYKLIGNFLKIVLRHQHLKTPDLLKLQISPVDSCDNRKTKDSVVGLSDKVTRSSSALGVKSGDSTSGTKLHSGPVSKSGGSTAAQESSAELQSARGSRALSPEPAGGGGRASRNASRNQEATPDGAFVAQVAKDTAPLNSKESSSIPDQNGRGPDIVSIEKDAREQENDLVKVQAQSADKHGPGTLSVVSISDKGLKARDLPLPVNPTADSQTAHRPTLSEVEYIRLEMPPYQTAVKPSFRDNPTVMIGPMLSSEFSVSATDEKSTNPNLLLSLDAADVQSDVLLEKQRRLTNQQPSDIRIVLSDPGSNRAAVPSNHCQSYGAEHLRESKPTTSSTPGAAAAKTEAEGNASLVSDDAHAAGEPPALAEAAATGRQGEHEDTTPVSKRILHSPSDEEVARIMDTSTTHQSQASSAATKSASTPYPYLSAEIMQDMLGGDTPTPQLVTPVLNSDDRVVTGHASQGAEPAPPETDKVPRMQVSASLPTSHLQDETTIKTQGECAQSVLPPLESGSTNADLIAESRNGSCQPNQLNNGAEAKKHHLAIMAMAPTDVQDQLKQPSSRLKDPHAKLHTKNMSLKDSHAKLHTRNTSVFGSTHILQILEELESSAQKRHVKMYEEATGRTGRGDTTSSSKDRELCILIRLLKKTFHCLKKKLDNCRSKDGKDRPVRERSPEALQTNSNNHLPYDDASVDNETVGSTVDNLEARQQNSPATDSDRTELVTLLSDVLFAVDRLKAHVTSTPPSSLCSSRASSFSSYKMDFNTLHGLLSPKLHQERKLEEDNSDEFDHVSASTSASREHVSNKNSIIEFYLKTYSVNSTSVDPCSQGHPGNSASGNACSCIAQELTHDTGPQTQTSPSSPDVSADTDQSGNQEAIPVRTDRDRDVLGKIEMMCRFLDISSILPETAHFDQMLTTHPPSSGCVCEYGGSRDSDAVEQLQLMAASAAADSDWDCNAEVDDQSREEAEWDDQSSMGESSAFMQTLVQSLQDFVEGVNAMHLYDFQKCDLRLLPCGAERGDEEDGKAAHAKGAEAPSSPLHHRAGERDLAVTSPANAGQMDSDRSDWVLIDEMFPQNRNNLTSPPRAARSSRNHGHHSVRKSLSDESTTDPEPSGISTYTILQHKEWACSARHTSADYTKNARICETPFSSWEKDSGSTHESDEKAYGYAFQRREECQVQTFPDRVQKLKRMFSCIHTTENPQLRSEARLDLIDAFPRVASSPARVQNAIVPRKEPVVYTVGLPSNTSNQGSSANATQSMSPPYRSTRQSTGTRCTEGNGTPNENSSNAWPKLDSGYKWIRPASSLGRLRSSPIVAGPLVQYTRSSTAEATREPGDAQSAPRAKGYALEKRGNKSAWSHPVDMGAESLSSIRSHRGARTPKKGTGSSTDELMSPNAAAAAAATTRTKTPETPRNRASPPDAQAAGPPDADREQHVSRRETCARPEKRAQATSPPATPRRVSGVEPSPTELSVSPLDEGSAVFVSMCVVSETVDPFTGKPILKVTGTEKEAPGSGSLLLTPQYGGAGDVWHLQRQRAACYDPQYMDAMSSSSQSSPQLSPSSTQPSPCSTRSHDTPGNTPVSPDSFHSLSPSSDDDEAWTGPDPQSKPRKAVCKRGEAAGEQPESCRHLSQNQNAADSSPPNSSTSDTFSKSALIGTRSQPMPVYGNHTMQPTPRLSLASKLRACAQIQRSAESSDFRSRGSSLALTHPALASATNVISDGSSLSQCSSREKLSVPDKIQFFTKKIENLKKTKVSRKLPVAPVYTLGKSSVHAQSTSTAAAPSRSEQRQGFESSDPKLARADCKSASTSAVPRKKDEPCACCSPKAPQPQVRRKAIPGLGQLGGNALRSSCGETIDGRDAAETSQKSHSVLSYLFGPSITQRSRARSESQTPSPPKEAAARSRLPRPQARRSVESDLRSPVSQPRRAERTRSSSSADPHEPREKETCSPPPLTDATRVSLGNLTNIPIKQHQTKKSRATIMTHSCFKLSSKTNTDEGVTERGESDSAWKEVDTATRATGTADGPTGGASSAGGLRSAPGQGLEGARSIAGSTSTVSIEDSHAAQDVVVSTKMSRRKRWKDHDLQELENALLFAADTKPQKTVKAHSSFLVSSGSTASLPESPTHVSQAFSVKRHFFEHTGSEPSSSRSCTAPKARASTACDCVHSPECSKSKLGLEQFGATRTRSSEKSRSRSRSENRLSHDLKECVLDASEPFLASESRDTTKTSSSKDSFQSLSSGDSYATASLSDHADPPVSQTIRKPTTTTNARNHRKNSLADSSQNDDRGVYKPLQPSRTGRATQTPSVTVHEERMPPETPIYVVAKVQVPSPSRRIYDNVSVRYESRVVPLCDDRVLVNRRCLYAGLHVPHAYYEIGEQHHPSCHSCNGHGAALSGAPVASQPNPHPKERPQQPASGCPGRGGVREGSNEIRLSPSMLAVARPPVLNLPEYVGRVAKFFMNTDLDSCSASRVNLDLGQPPHPPGGTAQAANAAAAVNTPRRPHVLKCVHPMHDSGKHSAERHCSRSQMQCCGKCPLTIPKKQMCQVCHTKPTDKRLSVSRNDGAAQACTRREAADPPTSPLGVSVNEDQVEAALSETLCGFRAIANTSNSGTGGMDHSDSTRKAVLLEKHQTCEQEQDTTFYDTLETPSDPTESDVADQQQSPQGPEPPSCTAADACSSSKTKKSSKGACKLTIGVQVDDGDGTNDGAASDKRVSLTVGSINVSTGASEEVTCVVPNRIRAPGTSVGTSSATQTDGLMSFPRCRRQRKAAKNANENRTDSERESSTVSDDKPARRRTSNKSSSELDGPRPKSRHVEKERASGETSPRKAPSQGTRAQKNGGVLRLGFVFPSRESVTRSAALSSSDNGVTPSVKAIVNDINKRCVYPRGTPRGSLEARRGEEEEEEAAFGPHPSCSQLSAKGSAFLSSSEDCFTSRIKVKGHFVDSDGSFQYSTAGGWTDAKLEGWEQPAEETGVEARADMGGLEKEGRQGHTTPSDNRRVTSCITGISPIASRGAAAITEKNPAGSKGEVARTNRGTGRVSEVEAGSQEGVRFMDTFSVSQSRATGQNYEATPLESERNRRGKRCAKSLGSRERNVATDTSRPERRGQSSGDREKPEAKKKTKSWGGKQNFEESDSNHNMKDRSADVQAEAERKTNRKCVGCKRQKAGPTSPVARIEILQPPASSEVQYVTTTVQRSPCVYDDDCFYSTKDDDPAIVGEVDGANGFATTSAEATTTVARSRRTSKGNDQEFVQKEAASLASNILTRCVDVAMKAFGKAQVDLSHCAPPRGHRDRPPQCVLQTETAEIVHDAEGGCPYPYQHPYPHPHPHPHPQLRRLKKKTKKCPSPYSHYDPHTVPGRVGRSEKCSRRRSIPPHADCATLNVMQAIEETRQLAKTFETKIRTRPSWRSACITQDYKRLRAANGTPEEAVYEERRLRRTPARFLESPHCVKKSFSRKPAVVVEKRTTNVHRHGSERPELTLQQTRSVELKPALRTHTHNKTRTQDVCHSVTMDVAPENESVHHNVSLYTSNEVSPLLLSLSDESDSDLSSLFRSCQPAKTLAQTRSTCVKAVPQHFGSTGDDSCCLSASVSHTTFCEVSQLKPCAKAETPYTAVSISIHSPSTRPPSTRPPSIRPPTSIQSPARAEPAAGRDNRSVAVMRPSSGARTKQPQVRVVGSSSLVHVYHQGGAPVDSLCTFCRSQQCRGRPLSSAAGPQDADNNALSGPSRNNNRGCSTKSGDSKPGHSKASGKKSYKPGAPPSPKRVSGAPRERVAQKPTSKVRSICEEINNLVGRNTTSNHSNTQQKTAKADHKDKDWKTTRFKITAEPSGDKNKSPSFKFEVYPASTNCSDEPITRMVRLEEKEPPDAAAKFILTEFKRHKMTVCREALLHSFPPRAMKAPCAKAQRSPKCDVSCKCVTSLSSSPESASSDEREIAHVTQITNQIEKKKPVPVVPPPPEDDVAEFKVQTKSPPKCKRSASPGPRVYSVEATITHKDKSPPPVLVHRTVTRSVSHVLSDDLGIRESVRDCVRTSSSAWCGSQRGRLAARGVCSHHSLTECAEVKRCCVPPEQGLGASTCKAASVTSQVFVAKRNRSPPRPRRADCCPLHPRLTPCACPKTTRTAAAATSVCIPKKSKSAIRRARRYIRQFQDSDLDLAACQFASSTSICGTNPCSPVIGYAQRRPDVGVTVCDSLSLTTLCCPAKAVPAVISVGCGLHRQRGACRCATTACQRLVSSTSVCSVKTKKVFPWTRSVRCCRVHGQQHQQGPGGAGAGVTTARRVVSATSVCGAAAAAAAAIKKCRSPAARSACCYVRPRKAPGCGATACKMLSSATVCRRRAAKAISPMRSARRFLYQQQGPDPVVTTSCHRAASSTSVCFAPPAKAKKPCLQPHGARCCPRRQPERERERGATECKVWSSTSLCSLPKRRSPKRCWPPNCCKSKQPFVCPAGPEGAAPCLLPMNDRRRRYGRRTVIKTRISSDSAMDMMSEALTNLKRRPRVVASTTCQTRHVQNFRLAQKSSSSVVSIVSSCNNSEDGGSQLRTIHSFSFKRNTKAKRLSSIEAETIRRLKQARRSLRTQEMLARLAHKTQVVLNRAVMVTRREIVEERTRARHRQLQVALKRARQKRLIQESQRLATAAVVSRLQRVEEALESSGSEVCETRSQTYQIMSAVTLPGGACCDSVWSTTSSEEMSCNAHTLRRDPSMPPQPLIDRLCSSCVQLAPRGRRQRLNRPRRENAAPFACPSCREFRMNRGNHCSPRRPSGKRTLSRREFRLTRGNHCSPRRRRHLSARAQSNPAKRRERHSVRRRSKSDSSVLYASTASLGTLTRQPRASRARGARTSKSDTCLCGGNTSRTAPSAARRSQARSAPRPYVHTKPAGDGRAETAKGRENWNQSKIISRTTSEVLQTHDSYFSRLQQMARRVASDAVRGADRHTGGRGGGGGARSCSVRICDSRSELHYLLTLKDVARMVAAVSMVANNRGITDRWRRFCSLLLRPTQAQAQGLVLARARADGGVAGRTSRVLSASDHSLLQWTEGFYGGAPKASHRARLPTKPSLRQYVCLHEHGGPHGATSGLVTTSGDLSKGRRRPPLHTGPHHRSRDAAGFHVVRRTGSRTARLKNVHQNNVRPPLLRPARAGRDRACDRHRRSAARRAHVPRLISTSSTAAVAGVRVRPARLSRPTALRSTSRVGASRDAAAHRHPSKAREARPPTHDDGSVSDFSSSTVEVGSATDWGAGGWCEDGNSLSRGACPGKRRSETTVYKSCSSSPPPPHAAVPRGRGGRKARLSESVLCPGVHAAGNKSRHRSRRRPADNPGRTVCGHCQRPPARDDGARAECKPKVADSVTESDSQSDVLAAFSRGNPGARTYVRRELSVVRESSPDLLYEEERYRESREQPSVSCLLDSTRTGVRKRGGPPKIFISALTLDAQNLLRRRQQRTKPDWKNADSLTRLGHGDTQPSHRHATNGRASPPLEDSDCRVEVHSHDYQVFSEARPRPHQPQPRRCSSKKMSFYMSPPAFETDSFDYAANTSHHHHHHHPPRRPQQVSATKKSKCRTCPPPALAARSNTQPGASRPDSPLTLRSEVQLLVENSMRRMMRDHPQEVRRMSYHELLRVNNTVLDTLQITSKTDADSLNRAFRDVVYHFYLRCHQPDICD